MLIYIVFCFLAQGHDGLDLEMNVKKSSFLDDDFNDVVDFLTLWFLVVSCLYLRNTGPLFFCWILFVSF